MGTEAPETPAAEAVDLAKLITIRPNGTLLFDGIAIGGLDAGAMLDDGTNARLTLNLGWMRLAGLHITVQADPDVDRKRDGIVLER